MLNEWAGVLMFTVLFGSLVGAVWLNYREDEEVGTLREREKSRKE